MLNKYDLRFKNFLKIQEKLFTLEEELGKLPLTKLSKPYNDGWIISYKLRDDIKRRKDNYILEEVLERGYSQYKTNNLNSVKAVRRGEKVITKVIKKKRVRIDLRPGKYCINEKRYLTLSDVAKKYFSLDTICDAYKIWGRKFYYAYLSDYYLVLRAKPNVITHTIKKGGEIESEIAFLRDQLYEFWREQHNYSKSYPRYKDRTKTRAKIQKFKKGELDDIYNERIPLEYEY